MDREAFLQHDRLDPGHHLVADRVVRRQEGEARRVGAGRGQFEVDGLAEETVGYLDEDAGAVAGVGLGTRGTAVLQVRQGEQTGADEFVRSFALHVRDERHATGVVFETRVVEAGGPGGRQHQYST